MMTVLDPSGILQHFHDARYSAHLVQVSLSGFSISPSKLGHDTNVESAFVGFLEQLQGSGLAPH